jgi:hypothetical protein
MAKGKRGLIEASCPACGATLKVDPETGAVISHQVAEKPREIESLEAGVARLQHDASRREDAFRKSVEEHKTHHQVLEKKFDELLRQAREKPDEPPPLRDIDLD